MRARLRDFFAAFIKSWFSAMSGPAGVGFTIAGAFAPSHLTKTILFIVAAWCVAFSVYWVWRIERLARIDAISEFSALRSELLAVKAAQPALELIFDEADDRCVRRVVNPQHVDIGKFWRVGVRNISTRSADDVSIRALDNDFVCATISIAHQSRNDRVPHKLIFFEIASLPPGACEFVDLFGLCRPADTDEPLFKSSQRFTLEARARDAQTVLADFEYQPIEMPMLKRISHDSLRVSS
jgi:hypothetical protein